MIERIITFSIRHRTIVIAGAVLLAVAGMLAVWDTPVDAIPDLSENQVLVFTEWAGHGPREIEDQVTYPLALQLQGPAGVRVVRSSTIGGTSNSRNTRRSRGDSPRPAIFPSVPRPVCA